MLFYIVSCSCEACVVEGKACEPKKWAHVVMWNGHAPTSKPIFGHD